MKRKLKTLTEQFTDARSDYNRILGRGDKQLMNEQGTPQRMGFLSCKCSDADQYGSCAAWRASSQYGNVSTTWTKQYLVGGQTPYVGQIIAPGAVSTNPGNSGFNTGAGYHVIDVLNPNTPPGPNWDALTGYHPSCNFTAPACDTTPASSCAQQWFGNPAQPWATSFMSSNDCTTYTWPATNLETQANTIMAGAPNLPTIPYTYNDWNDIKNAANASGLVNPQKGQFKRKMAKAMYSQCQIQACNC